jgi:hypothetical protein
MKMNRTDALLILGCLIVGSSFLGIEFGWTVGWGVGLINFAMLHMMLIKK